MEFKDMHSGPKHSGPEHSGRKHSGPKHTIRALYETEADAVQAREQLAAAGFGEVEILTRDGDGFVERLEHLVGRERAHHWRGQVERGRVVLAARVDELLQTEAAEIIEATSLGQIVHDGARGGDADPETGAIV